MADIISYDYSKYQTLDAVLYEAWRRADINPLPVDSEAIRSAQSSVAFELLNIPTLLQNLWLRQKQMIQIVAGQPTYTLPANTIQISDLIATNPQVVPASGIANGFPAATFGTNPANCFIPPQPPFVNAGCVQTGPNGWISYDYGLGNNQFVYFVSVVSLIPATYTLAIEYTLSDPVDDIWVTAQSYEPFDFIPHQTLWYVLEHSVVARAWRIRELNGATLAIQYISLAQPNTGGTTATDRWLTAQSQTIYMIEPNKGQIGIPAWYYFDLINPPTLTVWNAPDGTTYTNFMYVQYRLPAVNELFTTKLDLGPSFYDALAGGVAARLALKDNPQKYEMLKNEAAILYQRAGVSNVQPVAIDFSGRNRGY